MHLRPSIAAIVGLCGVLAVGTASAAPPSAINHLTNITGLPDARQQQSLQAFAEYYGRRLGSDDPRAVSDARDKLAKPLGALQLSRNFRSAYSDVLLPMLRPVVTDSGTLQGPMNAMQIAALLGTDQSLTLMQRHCSEKDEDHIGIRLWAARGMLLAISSGRDDGLIPDHKLPPAIRALGSAAQIESDWRVLQWQFDSLASIDHPVARSELENAFGKVLDRLAAENQATPLIKSLGQYNDPQSRPRGPLNTLNNRFLNMPPGQQRPVGIRLVGLLQQVLEVADAHWTSARADRDLKEAYRRAVRISEKQIAIVLVSLGLANVNTTLEKAFESGDQTAYQSQLAQVRDIVGRLR